MSANLKEVFDQNPADEMKEGDLFYIARSPYSAEDNFAIEWTVFLSFLQSFFDELYPSIPVPVAQGGTGRSLIANNSALIATDQTGNFAFLPTMTDGEVILGNTGGIPIVCDFVAGSGIDIDFDSEDKTLTFSNSFTPVNYVSVTSNTQIMAPNTIYYAENDDENIVFSVPTSFYKNSKFGVIGRGAGGWSIVFGSGQNGQNGDESTGDAGSWSSTSRYSVIDLAAVTDNTVLQVVGSVSQIDTNVI